MIKFLVEKNQAALTRTMDGSTALHLAANKDCAVLLLYVQMSLNYVDI
jgi:hypothetical protein